MGSPEEAQKAIDALNGKEMDGRALTVNIARPREERSGGGGGGRRGGFAGRGGDRGDRGGDRGRDRY
jgi:RNA recognition motif-containing protein